MKTTHALAPCFLFILVACGGASRGTVRGTELGERVEAPSASASHYSTTSSRDPLIGGERVAAVERGVLDAARSEGVTLEGDGRLALLAAWLGEHMQRGARLPPAEVTTFFAHHLGLPEATPHVLLVGQGDTALLASAVREGVLRYMRRQSYDAYGAAVVERQRLTISIVVLSARAFTMAPVPRAVDVGATIEVSGQVREGFSRPRFVVTDPSGETYRHDAAPDREFSLRLEAEMSGVYGVELLADSAAGGPGVLANFPVYVGVPVPSSVRIGADDVAAERVPPSTLEAQLLTMIDDARRAEGLAPLEAHAGVAEVARAHTDDMQANGFVAHRSPTTGEPRDRLARASISSGLVLENIGRGYSAREIHEGLMRSPGHRAAILNPDVTHVGLGARVDPGQGRDGYLVTQVFVRVNRAIDVASAPSELLERINAARSARGASPLELDENLQAASAQAAREYFASPSRTQQETVDGASAAVRRFAIAFRRIGGVMAIVSSLEEAATLEPTFDRELRYVGIGVAQGDRPDHPPGSIAVVILLAWPR